MIYSLNEICVDEPGFELRRSGKVVAIEPRALELIIYLIHRKSRVVSKRELLDSLWKDTCVVESVVPRCACIARRSLGDPSLIRTVYGRGYRWIVPSSLEPRVLQETINRVTPKENLIVT